MKNNFVGKVKKCGSSYHIRIDKIIKENYDLEIGSKVLVTKLEEDNNAKD